jgi:phage tail tape-measure protein
MPNDFDAESPTLGSGESSHFPRLKKPDKPAKIRSSSEPARPIQSVGAFRTRMHRNQGCSASSGARRDAGQNLGIETTPIVAMATLGRVEDIPSRRAATRFAF